MVCECDLQEKIYLICKIVSFVIKRNASSVGRCSLVKILYIEIEQNDHISIRIRLVFSKKIQVNTKCVTLEFHEQH